MNFRAWCYEKWHEHCDEIEQWTGRRPSYLSAEYFSKYKWWLRREFRSTVAKEQRRRELDLRRRVLLDLD